MFLVTTALEETWEDHGEILFLGEWCRRFSRKNQWSVLNAQMAPYHWDDRRKLHDDYQKLQALQEKLLTDLTAQLNQIHGVDHGIRYWRIVIGPWLGYFVPILFDRWTSIQNACKNNSLTGTVVLQGHEGFFVPKNMEDFKQLILGDDWNHFIYSEILRRTVPALCSVKPRTQKPKPAGTNDSKLISLCKKTYSCISRLFVKENDSFFLSTYMTSKDLIKLQMKLKQFPQLWSLVQPMETNLDEGRRQWIVSGESGSDFEKFAREQIPKQIPIIYLEGYGNIIEQVKRLPWPKKPKNIFTSNAHFGDDVFKIWTAEKVEAGSRLMIGQHGGHYGIGRWSFPESHELAICDSYLSWGWGKENPKIKPVGYLKNQNVLPASYGSNVHALLVTTAVPRQSYYMFSAIVSKQWLDYFDDQCRFVKSLPENIRQSLIVRPYFFDYQWDQRERWQERFPKIFIDGGRTKINDLIQKSRIYISTYNATTFLESMTLDVPTVMYWNPDQWEIRDSAIPYFESLKRVGIFHRTPESAASHIATIWNDVEKWWQSAEVREVLETFKKQYCSQPTDLLDRLALMLRSESD